MENYPRNKNVPILPPWRRPMQGVLQRKRLIRAVEEDSAFIAEPSGFWDVGCDNEDRDNNGLTELDRVWSAVKELVTENVFIQAVYKPSLPSFLNDGLVPNEMTLVSIYVENYLDLENVLNSAIQFRKRVHYPFTLYMKTNIFTEDKRIRKVMRYLQCVDGDLYEKRPEGFRFIERNTFSTN